MKKQAGSVGGERNHGLSDTALAVLSEAAGRENRMVLPLPDSVRVRGGAKDKLLRKLVRLELVEDVPAAEAEHVWWRADNGRRVALQISAKGLHAIGIEEVAEDVNGRSERAEQVDADSPTLVDPCGGREVKCRASAGILSDAAVKTNIAAVPLVRPGSKQALLVSHLSSEEGCTLDELVKLLGWQRHTVRAALTGLRKKGFRMTKSRSEEGDTRYRASYEVVGDW